MGEYLQEAVLPVQYDNYVFDLYGTLVGKIRGIT